MLTQPGRRARHASRAAVAVLSTIFFASSCDKVPLLAPTGTVITLFPSATTVPVDGNVEIVATVIENGTASSAFHRHRHWDGDRHRNGYGHWNRHDEHLDHRRRHARSERHARILYDDDRTD